MFAFSGRIGLSFPHQIMEFKIDGVIRQFIPLKTYREMYRLPPDFHINRFEAKIYAGLGSIESAATELATLRANILQRLPNYTQPQAWLNHQPPLQVIFREELLAINHVVGLHEPEVDFAMAGFGDVCHQWIYALIYAQATKNTPPPFSAVYHDWLMNSLRVAQTRHAYIQADETWLIQVISHAYGRIGLQIQRGNEPIADYALDMRLACPAENFMDILLATVAEHIQQGCGL